MDAFLDEYFGFTELESNKLLKANRANTRGNPIVKILLQKATAQLKREMEQLIAGETIEKWVAQELAYNELDKTIENLWSVLFVTGYLTRRGEKDDGSFSLAIPNREIRELM